MKTCHIDDPEHRKSLSWLKIRGIGATGKKAKRKLHRRERHQTRQQIRTQLQTTSL